jgi:lipoprotein-releasing system permease protein
VIKKYEWDIAWRYLRSKQKEGLISIITSFSLAGIALGVATLIIVMSVMNGYEVELIKRIIGINGHLNISKVDGNITGYSGYILKIEQIPEAKFVAPLVMGQGMLSSDVASCGVMVRGMSEESLRNKPTMESSIKFGDIYKNSSNQIVIGTTLAYKLNVSIGDKVRLISASSDVTILGTMPKIKTYYVSGIFDVGMYEYNATTIFMPIDQAQLYFDYDDAISDIEVVLNHPKQAEEFKKELAVISEPDFSINDVSQSHEQLVAALRVERNVMFLILTMIIIVAAFNIVSSMIMLVKDKTKSIAILRTIGVTKRSMLKIFIICGTFIGLVGSVLGGGIGILVSLHIETIRTFLENFTGVALFDPVIYYLTKLPSELDYYNVALVLSMSMTLSFLATIYPAWRAANLMPAQALRYE